MLSKNYEVWGLIRRHSQPNTSRIDHILNKINLIDGDLADQNSLYHAIEVSQPEKLFHLGSMSFVGTSWDQAEHTLNITGLGSLRVFEAVRKINKDIKILQASSSEMFGAVTESPQTENSILAPKSPYGVAKTMAYHQSMVHRQSYGMFISNSICYNHESNRRSIEFLTKKVTDGLAKIHLGLSDTIRLGNLDSSRDWSHAKDVVRAMDMILNHSVADNFVVASGIEHSIRDLLDIGFEHIGISDWSKFITQDPRYMRPNDLTTLRGDATKIRSQLGWKPEISFKQMITEMIDFDIERLQNNS